jgi:oligopeptide/dipeptide ABC transporter ATP-binding protein
MAILADLRAERSLATLFITHDLELAIAVCDRILVMYAGTIVEDSPAASLHERARHPYTIGLLASRPDPVRKTARLQVIPGRPIAAAEAGAGCPFAGRCAYATERCRAERPLLREVAGGLVACHHAETVLAGRAAAGTEAR